MSGRGLIVTGTDTGVGKTVVAAALAAWARRRGVEIGVMKPVATGGRPGRGGCVSDDARTLARAARAADPWPLVTPVCLEEPLAPWTAARRAHRVIRLAPILAAFRRLAGRHGWVIVEGVGGVLVPLSRRVTVLDLFARLQLPAVVVARPDLGTLNHTLLTLAALRRARVPVAGVLISHARPRPRSRHARVAQRTNAALLPGLAGVRLLGEWPYAPRLLARPPERVARWVEAHTDRRWLRAVCAAGRRRR